MTLWQIFIFGIWPRSQKQTKNNLFLFLHGDLPAGVSTKNDQCHISPLLFLGLEIFSTHMAWRFVSSVLTEYAILFCLLNQ